MGDFSLKGKDVKSQQKEIKQTDNALWTIQPTKHYPSKSTNETMTASGGECDNTTSKELNWINHFWINPATSTTTYKVAIRDAVTNNLIFDTIGREVTGEFSTSVPRPCGNLVKIEVTSASVDEAFEYHIIYS